MPSENKNNTLLKRTLRFFNNYYVLRLVLLVLVGLFIWFIGPAISIYKHYFLESTLSKFLLILFITFVVLIYEAFKWLKARKAILPPESIELFNNEILEAWGLDAKS